MSFLAPFLFGLAGFAAVPILLHLIRRKRVRVLDFPTFRFLQKAALQQRLHLRLQDQLLMLLRILAILLLALAFVGPLTSRAVEPGGPPVWGEQNLLILDDSLSMSALSEGEVTLFSKAFEIGRALTTRAAGGWRVALAGEVEGSTGSDSFPGAAPEEFFEAGPLRSNLNSRFSIYETVRKAAARADSNTVVWTITDAAASNFPASATSSTPGAETLNFLVVDKPENFSNWAIRDLTLNNQPLVDGEPALLTAAFEQFGPSGVGQDPEAIEFAWRSEGDPAPQTAGYSLNEASGTEGQFQTALDVSGTIASASCRLVFREGAADALAGDNSRAIYPRTLGGLTLTVLAESENWRRMLQAALVDYRVISADPTQPRAVNLEPSSAFILLFGERSLHDDWRTYLQFRLEAGAGLLVFYDERPTGARLETWSKGWTGLGERIRIETLEPGSRGARGGADPWFSQSLQDLLLTQLGWAEGEFELVLIPKWEGEWFLSGGTAGFLPIFQTSRKGAGVAASFGVPLSLEVSPLILEPYWVPLLSQMVKRTLFDPRTLPSAPDRQESGSGESDLEPLSEEAKETLSASGLRFIDAERFVADVEKIPSRSHDWTVVCLLACLGLAILEIAVSNLV